MTGVNMRRWGLGESSEKEERRGRGKNQSLGKTNEALKPSPHQFDAWRTRRVRQGPP